MKNLTLRQTIIPIITLSIICFIWFGPIERMMIENIIISIIIILANYIEYKGKPFSSLGFQRKNFNFKNLLVIAPLVALGLFALYVLVLVPGFTIVTGDPIDYSSFDQLEGDLFACLVALPIVWLTAAFGEEIIFRGYFMRQFIKFFGDSKVSIMLNIILFACFFGFMHSQQGLTGQLVTGSMGALLALIFYLRKYDLWFVIVIHGFFDSLALVCIYFGLA